MADSISAIVTSMGFSSIESFIGLLLLAGFIIGAIVVIVTIKPVFEMFPYAYPNARVRARIGRLITQKQFSEILESENLEEVKNYLRGFPEYSKYVDKYPLEKALDIQLAETHDLIARIAPGGIKDVFRVLLKKWDINNIKTLITAKEAGLNPEKTAELLIPFGEISDVVEKLVEVKSVTEVIIGLEGTEYSQILEDALTDYEEKGMVLPLEAALDKFYLENLLKAVSDPSDANTTLLHPYIGTQVDASNLKIILRAKADGLKYDDISPYMISKGYQIRDWKLKDLMESEDVSGVISALEGTDYSAIMVDALAEYNKTGSIAPFEAALSEYIQKTAKTLSLKKPFGIGPMIGFLSRKEVEIKNLKVIVRGKRESGFPVSVIKEMLV
ncbi:MAG: V-type ATP synthase subunit C [Euryarchaeota archaeon]|nr:V-type ATP synthase subunit C [Euryarchaeota archaeon]MBU4607960.1 V-type ATP synthase subunit C [Euryarchaeota archaeon]MBV1729712.1 V-type ATP synthase subunit C [Methanobacterium sp.]MBV1754973.1 V-type ATP synthase subunit C [Methanobacterium sp.]